MTTALFSIADAKVRTFSKPANIFPTNFQLFLIFLSNLLIIIGFRDISFLSFFDRFLHRKGICDLPAKRRFIFLDSHQVSQPFLFNKKRTGTGKIHITGRHERIFHFFLTACTILFFVRKFDISESHAMLPVNFIVRKFPTDYPVGPESSE